MKTPALAAPLSGITVLVTRPRDSDSVLPRTLRRAGATVVWQPTIRIDACSATPALDRALGRQAFDWIVLSSVHGVTAFWRRARALGTDLEHVRSKFAAVGPATARAIERNGVDVTVTAYPHSADGLIAAMAPHLEPGSTVLYPRAGEVRPTLVDGLRRLGATVIDVPVYDTVPVLVCPSLSSTLSSVDCIVFCSSSAVRAVLPHRGLIERSVIACLGPTTAGAARAAGLEVRIVPHQATAFALADAVIEHFHPSAAAAPGARKVDPSAAAAPGARRVAGAAL